MPNLKNVSDIWTKIKTNGNFRCKYQYMEWKFLEHLNNSAPFLQIISIYNMISPVISLLMPVMMLFVPFIILQTKKINITFNQYLRELKVILKEHAIGKLLFEFQNLEWSQRFYLLLSIGFYFFQIYQNIESCISFYSNMKLIHTYIQDISNYIYFTCNNIDHFLKYSADLATYSEFNKVLLKNKTELYKFYTNISGIREYKLNAKGVLKIGYVMKQFYQLYCNETYNNALMYSFGFNGYIDTILGVQGNIAKHHIGFCKFNSGTKKCKFKDAYYIKLMDETAIPNTYSLKNNLIITGPNAAGKTTLLKTTIINLLLSQQIGAGAYSSAKITPYHYFYCYLNIPDTSGRDSLFQAEARQCKNIIQAINENKKMRHFCILDELYSGTNPYEATASAYSFLEYMTKYTSVDFMLTTHYIELCDKLKDNKRISNHHMKIKFDEDRDMIYTYKLAKGVSYVKGGAKVLSDLNYPKEILKLLK